MTGLPARLFGLLLRLYPLEVRQRFGPGILETVEARLAEAHRNRGPAGRVTAVVVEAFGMIRAALAERISLRRGPERGSAADPPTGRSPVASALRDLKHAVSNLRRSPVFTAAALITLAVGLGGTIAIFTVVRGIVMRPLPYPEAERLVWVDHGAAGIGVDQGLGITSGIYRHYQNRQTTLEQLAAFQSIDLTMTGVGAPTRMHGAVSAWTLGPALAVPVLRGRWLDPTDRDDRLPVVVLGFDLWRSRFGSDPAVVGRIVEFNGIGRQVVGVMPPNFAFPDRQTSFWIPLAVDPNGPVGGFSLKAIGRLSPHATVETAEADLRSAIGSLAEAFPDGSARGYLEEARVTPRLTDLKDHEVGRVARGLWILLGTTGLVLLIVCANLANLFLVRAESRRREMAVRSALGATRGDLARLFLTESALLTVAGAFLGTVLAALGIRALVANGPAYLPRLDAVRLDGSVIAFALGVAALASVVFAAAPLGRRTASLTEALRSGGRGATTGRGAFRLRQILATGQVAAAAVLLTAGGLMGRSYWKLLRVDPGFQADGALTFELGLPGAKYPTRDAAAAFQQNALEHFRAMPGVTAAGLVSCLPLNGWCWGDPLSVEGRIVPEGTIPPVVAMRIASEGYFAAAGIPILAGRGFERADQDLLTNAAVISRRLADLYFPDSDPLGRRVMVGGVTPDAPWFTIVGIAADVPAISLQRGADPLIYYPMRNRGRGVPATHQMTAVLRTTGPAADLAPPARRIVTDLDPDLPLANVRTLDSILSDASAETAFTMTVIAIAGLMALLLSVVGVYGVVAYVVTQRRGEMGVRAALGATGTDIRRLVSRQSLGVAIGGAIVGLAAAASVSRVMQSLLFDIAPNDVRTYTAVAAVLVAVSWLAGLGPARTAAAVNPADAMRAE